MRPAVFIDKDGTLVDNVPWNVDPALLRFRPGAGEALAALAAAGYALVVVSNQSGIADGRFSTAQFERLVDGLQLQLKQRFGVQLTDFVHCPHAAPAQGGLPLCACRKPLPGMLLKAAQRHRLALEASWMVGDILDDIEAGHRAGCRGVLYESGGETLWQRSPLREPDHRTPHWREVADHILVHSHRAAAA